MGVLTMGANSIDIDQYRSRIGTFAGQQRCKIKPSSGNALKSNSVLQSFIILCYRLAAANVTQTLLIISGVELNPGPFDLGKK